MCVSVGITPSYFAPGAPYHLGSHLSQASPPTTQVSFNYSGVNRDFTEGTSAIERAITRDGKTIAMKHWIAWRLTKLELFKMKLVMLYPLPVSFREDREASNSRPKIEYL